MEIDPSNLPGYEFGFFHRLFCRDVGCNRDVTAAKILLVFAEKKMQMWDWVETLVENGPLAWTL
jgi:hypothetical protein